MTSLASVDATLGWLRAPPFERWGVPFPFMDLIGAFRLAVVLRQIKKLKGAGVGADANSWDTKVSPWATALILFGGEAVICSLLSLTPSFLISPNVTLLFMGVQFVVNEFPVEPPPFRFSIELPLAVFDAFGRALLLCDFAPSLVAKHPDPVVANSPLALLITSELLTNGGFFFVNLLNMLDPRGWRLDRTPPEVLPWGWTTVDLWSAPAITALWATLTHFQGAQSQSIWTDIHTSYVVASGSSGLAEEKQPVAPDAWSHSDARALCIAVLITLFVARTWWNMGPLPKFKAPTKTHSPAPSTASHTELIEVSSITGTPLRKRRNKHSRGKSLTKDE
ncbi:hypothetical protein BDV93DRAFT_548585 [Ceratobasidium sp. AG-I]|nr:hypothetical protein BDV93DRAFT_548585 [Ceratobasidium sp. AG-I]